MSKLMNYGIFNFIVLLYLIVQYEGNISVHQSYKGYRYLLFSSADIPMIFDCS